MKRSLVTTSLIAGLAGMLSGQTTTTPAAPTYTINTVAGSASNSLGDGGNAAGATLITPIDAVADAAGNVRYADINRAVTEEETGVVKKAARESGLWRFAEPARHGGFNI